MSTRSDHSKERPTIVRLKRHDLPGEEVVLPWSDARLAGMDVACVPTILASCYFPRRKTEEDAVLRRNGAESLVIASQPLEIDEKLVRPGLPFGAPSRLIFTALTTLAKLQDALRSDLRPKLYLPRSVRAFHRFVHGEKAAAGADRGIFVQHFYRLLATEFTATRKLRVDDGAGSAQRGWSFRAVRIVEEAELWWNPKDVEGMPLFPSWLRLTQRFWEWLDASAIPLDWRAYRSHALSPLTMDIDAWLAARLPRLTAEALVSWEQLYSQFVGEAVEPIAAASRSSRLRKFKSDFVASLRRTLQDYREARVCVERSGLRLFPSPPWVDFTKQMGRLVREADIALPE